MKCLPIWALDNSICPTGDREVKEGFYMLAIPHFKRSSTLLHTCDKSQYDWFCRNSSERDYFDWLAEALGHRSKDEWHNVTKLTILNTGGTSILAKYGGSICKTLANVYPCSTWHPWRFAWISPSLWNDTEEQRRYVIWLAEQLNFEELSEWYNVKKSDFVENCGTSILNYYKGNFVALLMSVFDSFQWKPWKFENKPKGFWADGTNQRKFFDWLAELAEIKHVDDWYHVTRSDVLAEFGAARALGLHNGSFIDALMNIYPHTSWKPWLFAAKSAGFWSDIQHQRQYLLWMTQQLGYHDFEDWYQLKSADFKEMGGAGVLCNRYCGSYIKMLQTAFPDYNWLPWLFTNPPLGKHETMFNVVAKDFWNDLDNQMSFFEWASVQLNIDEIDKWQLVSESDIKEIGGEGLMENHYAWSLRKALMTLYPDLEWILWNEIEGNNAENAIQYLAKQLSIQYPSDWYKVATEDVLDRGGKYLLFHYNGLVSKLLNVNFPEYRWHPWQFDQIPIGYWDHMDHQKEYLKWIEDKLGVTNPEDWYGITYQQIAVNDGGSLLTSKYSGSVINFVKTHYPGTTWDAKVWQNSSTSKAQMFLFKCVQRLLPAATVTHNYVLPSLFEKSKGRMTLDIYVPDLRLAIEYQGAQHYISSYFGPQIEQQFVRDEEKRKVCLREGITLVNIPHWWDFTIESLGATLHKYRPLVFQAKGIPISENSMEM